jgi:hypothetical protein
LSRYHHFYPILFLNWYVPDIKEVLHAGDFNERILCVWRTQACTYIHECTRTVTQTYLNLSTTRSQSFDNFFWAIFTSIFSAEKMAVVSKINATINVWNKIAVPIWSQLRPFFSAKMFLKYSLGSIHFHIVEVLWIPKYKITSNRQVKLKLMPMMAPLRRLLSGRCHLCSRHFLCPRRCDSKRYNF